MANFSENSLKKSTTFFNILNEQIMSFKNDLIISDESEPQKTVNESNLNMNGYNSVECPQIQSIRAVPEPRKSDNLSDETLV